MNKRTSFLLILMFLIVTIPSHAQWIQTNGPYGGQVQCFLVSGANLFVGTSNAGVFVSTNDGTSWAPLNNGLTNLSVRALVISGTNLFAGTGGGVFLSKNA